VPGMRPLNTYEVARKVGAPILHQPAKEITTWDRTIQAMGLKLKMHVARDPNSAGVAAPQLGLPWRMVAYRDSTRGRVHVITNPVVSWMSVERHTDIEGCFSMRDGDYVLVERSVRVRVEACDLHGLPVWIEPEGYGARVLQHEIDHLNGIVICDLGDVVTREQLEALEQLNAEDEETVEA
jgi:peptide deformylase